MASLLRSFDVKPFVNNFGSRIKLANIIASRNDSSGFEDVSIENCMRWNDI